MLRDRTEANASEDLIRENAQNILHTSLAATTCSRYKTFLSPPQSLSNYM